MLRVKVGRRKKWRCVWEFWYGAAVKGTDWGVTKWLMCNTPELFCAREIEQMRMTLYRECIRAWLRESISGGDHQWSASVKWMCSGMRELKGPQGIECGYWKWQARCLAICCLYDFAANYWSYRAPSSPGSGLVNWQLTIFYRTGSMEDVEQENGRNGSATCNISSEIIETP